MSAFTSVAQAVVLGEVIGVSAVGQPLRVEIRSPGAGSEAASQCLRIRPVDDGDGIPAIRRADIHIARPGADARIVVTHDQPTVEPVLRLALESICESRLRREYVLLLSEPIARPPTTVAVPTPAAPPRAATRTTAPTAGTLRGGQTWTTVSGESVHSIAQALYPRDDGARQAFIAAVVRGNPQLFPDGTGGREPLPTGTTLQIPNLARIAAASSRPAPAARQPAPAPAPAAPVPPVAAETPPGTPEAEGRPAAAASPESGADRLVLEGSADAVRAPSDPRLTGELDAREAQLVATIDRSINLQIELEARIRRLEEIQLAMRAQLESPQAQLAPAPPAATDPAPAPVPAPAPPIRTEPIPERDPAPRPSGTSDWALWLALFGAIVLVTLLWRRSSQRHAEERTRRERSQAAASAAAPVWPDDAPVDIGERAEKRDNAPATTVGDIAAPRPAGPLEWDGTPRTASPEEETVPPLATLGDEAVEEHDSAVELADIMMSFGRLHGAAETLAEFIRSNPKQAVTPWLKLMEVYRAADMRPEFDALARQLNKTFNVKTVTWENFEQSRTLGGSLETMPHIIEHLQKTWGSRDCQAYIEKIVRDNRDGTRQGFPLAVVDELLTLSSVLEEQLGRYRPAEAA